MGAGAGVSGWGGMGGGERRRGGRAGAGPGRGGWGGRAMPISPRRRREGKPSHSLAAGGSARRHFGEGEGGGGNGSEGDGALGLRSAVSDETRDEGGRVPPPFRPAFRSPGRAAGRRAGREKGAGRQRGLEGKMAAKAARWRVRREAAVAAPVPPPAGKDLPGAARGGRAAPALSERGAGRAALRSPALLWDLGASSACRRFSPRRPQDASPPVSSRRLLVQRRCGDGRPQRAPVRPRAKPARFRGSRLAFDWRFPHA